MLTSTIQTTLLRLRQFLCSVTVIRAQDYWGVTYRSTQICAVKGSTVEINCSYTYPSRANGYNIAVQETFWFTRLQDEEPVDVRTQSEYAGRVEYQCKSNICSLRIIDLRESDSTEYKFRLITNDPSGKYTASPGVTLTVTGTDEQSDHAVTLICHSSCLTDRFPFVWYENETFIQDETSPSYGGHFDPEYRYSCASQGHRSHSVCEFTSLYAPIVPSVSINPPGDIMKNSSVTLSCSSDANPAAKYTWYKKNQTLLSEEPQLIFISIQPSDTGEYYCTAENRLERTTSKHVFVNGQYGPKTCSVSVSPSAEIMEGSSVTLSCSSDANPAANYTWYKENQTLAEHTGNYYCEAQNTRGRLNSTFGTLNLTLVLG
uniref:B-cell receptor CD22 n=1 Tax=Mola mola TaxID=94237 RepID=A0A3Q4BR32_MOLML